jgi:hypothetical protein
MALTNTTIQNILKLLMQAVNWANIADNAGSSPATIIYVSLHTADPGTSGNQTTNEAAYTSYARVAVARDGTGWSLSGNTISPGANINFPTSTGGSETETFAGIGLSSSGAGVLLWSGAITPSIVVTSGVTPQLTTASTITLA